MARFEKYGPSFDSLHVNKSGGVSFGGTDLVKSVIGGIGESGMAFGCKHNDNGCGSVMGRKLIKMC